MSNFFFGDIYHCAFLLLIKLKYFREPCYFRFLRYAHRTFESQQKNGISAVLTIKYGGDKGDRTPDLLTASQALSQLSYAPTIKLKLVFIFW